MLNESAATPLKILITDAQELAALGAIRSLGRAGHRVVAACPRRFVRPASLWSRYCGELRISPDPWRSHLDFRDWIAGQLAGGEFDAVLPISEGAILALAAVREAAPPGVLLLLPGDASLEFALSKYQATRKALDCGILCPPTLFLDPALSPAALESQIDSMKFPVIFKIDNVLTGCGVYRKGRTTIARDRAALLAAIAATRDSTARKIVQQLIPGSGAGAFFLRAGGRIHLEFAHRRLHEVPYTGGISSLRESCHDEAMMSEGRRLLESMDYEGVAMVEFRRGEHDGRLYFLEINGRLWGSMALALHCGIDFPRALLECHRSGRPGPTQRDYPDGLRCRNYYPGECAYMLSILRARRARHEPGLDSPPPPLQALREFIAMSLSPSIRDDHFWPTDPGPALVQGLCLAKRVLRKVKRLVIAPARWVVQSRRERSLRASHAARVAAVLSPRPSQILFLCYGNICRSPFAEFYWNARRRQEGASAMPVANSAGFYHEMGRRTPGWINELALEHGIDLQAHRSRGATREMIDQAGAIFVMDRVNHRQLLECFPQARDKVFYLGLFAEGAAAEIEDPFSFEEDEARVVYNKICAALDGLWKTMKRD